MYFFFGPSRKWVPESSSLSCNAIEKKVYSTKKFYVDVLSVLRSIPN
jgi:hypothetical protein